LGTPDHEHTFGQQHKKPGENRTWIVIALTGTMMVGEIIAGVLFGSMALLADGLHMASHAVALAINALAYVYARRHAGDARFTFGTGKVNALGGFTGAILLAGFALVMAYESIERLFVPVEIEFMNAVVVAIIGLVVNGVSVLILGNNHSHGHARAHGRGHDHDHDHDHHAHGGRDRDHNLRAAYFHVLADTLTSFTAIFALLAGRFLGAAWMDPVMGIVGSILVANWSIRLLRDTSRVLLDRQAEDAALQRVTAAIARAASERGAGERVADLHMWSIGPGIYNLSVAIVSTDPQDPDHYKALVPDDMGIVHSTVEVHSGHIGGGY
jgi:cation diffusion facilitator family transporter